MLRCRPFGTVEDLFEAADAIWSSLSSSDWIEAFSHHPKIGDIESMRIRFSSTSSWSKEEQSGISAAHDEVLKALAEGNRKYEERFGYIFIVYATGKSAEEMLALLNERLSNDPAIELTIAADEQRKIMRLRLDRLLSLVQGGGEEQPGSGLRSEAGGECTKQ